MIVQTSNITSAPNTSTLPAQKAVEENPKGITVQITPGENNSQTGDRSANTVDISITTPNRQVSAEITREQGIDSLERHLQKSAIDQFNNSNKGISPLTLKAIQNNDIDSGKVLDAAAARNQKKLAETYLNASPNNSQQSNGNADSNNAVSLANQAIDTYIKHTLFFSSVDKATSSFTANA